MDVYMFFKQPIDRRDGEVESLEFRTQLLHIIDIVAIN